MSNWPGLLSHEDACRYLSIGRDKFRELMLAGSIKPVELPGRASPHLKFRLSDLDRFIDSLKEISSSKAIRQRQKTTEAARLAKAAKELVETRSE